VELTKVVGRVELFQRTDELAVKFDPLTVRVKAGPPAGAVEGLRPVMVGASGAPMVKVEPLDVAPLSLTVIVADPCEAIRVAVTAAVNWVALTKVVVRAEPLQRTDELAVKLEPLTVRVNAGPPAGVVEGLRLVMVGASGAPMVKVEPLDVAPLSLTVIVADPCEAMRVAVTAAVNWVPLTKVVVRAEPFQRIDELAVKPEPLTVRVKFLPPAGAVEGFRLVIVRASAVMVKAEPLEVAPFALTVTVADPCEAMRVAAMEAVN
jgi:hypothetical protein